jgi:hypothetical protein
MKKLVKQYVDRYLSTAEYCWDEYLDTDKHIDELKQGYRELYGNEAAELLFQLGDTLIQYERDCMRLAMVMLKSGVMTDELRDMLG